MAINFTILVGDQGHCIPAFSFSPPVLEKGRGIFAFLAMTPRIFIGIENIILKSNIFSLNGNIGYTIGSEPMNGIEKRFF